MGAVLVGERQRALARIIDDAIAGVCTTVGKGGGTVKLELVVLSEILHVANGVSAVHGVAGGIGCAPVVVGRNQTGDALRSL